jgi:mycothiol synthase
VSLPQAITRRALTKKDAEVVAVLCGEDEAAFNGRPSQLSANDILAWWSRTDLEKASWLLEEDGRVVGVGWLERDGHELAVFVSIVAQGEKGRGLGAAMMDLGEEAAAAAGATRMQTFALGRDTAAADLFTTRGYREVRRFYDMAIELEGPVEVPAVPDGMSLESFEDSDARPFYEAMDEAFRDHWEHHPIPFEQWWDEKLAAPDYDPSLWYLVRDGGELAAVIRNDPDRNGGGYVASLGVRRAWRRRGLARLLLLHTFAEFQRRGKSRVTLGVDAESPTGATKLYDGVGMHVEMEMIVFEKARA